MRFPTTASGLLCAIFLPSGKPLSGLKIKPERKKIGGLVRRLNDKRGKGKTDGKRNFSRKKGEKTTFCRPAWPNASAVNRMVKISRLFSNHIGLERFWPWESSA